jgi:hypothetical protein
MPSYFENNARQIVHVEKQSRFLQVCHLFTDETRHWLRNCGYGMLVEYGFDLDEVEISLGDGPKPKEIGFWASANGRHIAAFVGI